MVDILYDKFNEALNIAMDAFQQIEDIRADLCEEILATYDFENERELDDFYYLFDGLFQFINCGGMVLEAPGAPEVEDVIRFLEERC